MGLDVGDRFIKAVAVARTIRGGIQVEYCAARRRGAEEEPADAVAALFAEHEALRNLPCITALPAREFSFRDLTFPFRDKKKIRQALPFEIEPLLPVPMEAMLVDYLLANAAGEARVLAAAVPRETVQGRLDLLRGHVRDVVVLDVEAVPLTASFVSRQAGADYDLLLDVGARRTVALFIKDRSLFQIRNHVLRMDPDDADAAGVASSSAEDGPVEAFGRELRNTVDFLKWRGFTTGDPSRIYLTGGGGGDRRFDDVLGRHFSAPLERVDMACVAGIAFAETAKRQWQPLLMNQALALAVRPFRKEAGYDFRKRRRREEAGYRPFKKNIPWLAAALGIILLLTGADFFLDYYDAKVRLSQLKRQINGLYRQYSPETVRIVDPVAQLRAQIAESKKSMLGMMDSTPRAAALDVLKDISAAIPPATEILVTAMTMEREAVVVKGEAKNFDAVQAVRNDLGKAKLIKSVDIGATNLMKQGEKVEFELRLTTK